MPNVYRMRELATFLSASRGSAVYCGFVGYKNLGDEVLWDQIRRAFAPLRLVCAPPLGGGIRKRLVELKKYERVILGGGTLIGANLPDGSNPFRQHFQWFRARARRAIAFGTGVGKLSDNPSENRWLQDWKPLLDEFEYVGVRGPMSVRALASIGIDAELLGDPACLISQVPGFWSPPKAKVLGINIGELDKRSEVETAKETNFVDALSLLVKERAGSGWRIEFFVVIPSDCQIVDKVVSQSGLTDYRIHEIYDDGYQYINAVKHVTAFIGMKLHSVILAMCAGVPSIMVSYAPKCDDFMMSVELDEFIIELEGVSVDALNGKLERLLTSSNEIGEHLAKRMNDYRTKQLARAEAIRAQRSMTVQAVG